MKVCELKGMVEYIRKQIICYVIFLLMIFTMSYSVGKYHSLFTKYTTLQSDLQSQVDITKSLEEYKENLLAINSDLADKYNTELLDGINKSFNYIEPLRLYDKQAYIIAYTNIIEDLEDPPESIYDYTTDEEFNLICGVIEAESGICDFDGKINVATVIVNRYLQGMVTWNDVLFEDNQFSTISNGAYKKVEISEDTKLALEYAFLFKNEEIGDATYFRSGDDNTGWHNTSDSLEEVYFDGWHHFFIEIRKENK